MKRISRILTRIVCRWE